ncbi:MAG: hypothetical protein NWF08_00535 [Candidatus Bathyarchaeota archaeon]|nr:hypothetical protein [Candidatus Bathyarchaeota archaeon]
MKRFLLHTLVFTLLLGVSTSHIQAQELMEIPMGTIPRINGRISFDEWDDALEIEVIHPWQNLRLKTDCQNLYILFQAKGGRARVFYIAFDANQNNESYDAGDDIKILLQGEYRDNYYTEEYFFEPDLQQDGEGIGTYDEALAIWTYELAIPKKSTDPYGNDPDIINDRSILMILRIMFEGEENIIEKKIIIKPIPATPESPATPEPSPMPTPSPPPTPAPSPPFTQALVPSLEAFQWVFLWLKILLILVGLFIGIFASIKVGAPIARRYEPFKQVRQLKYQFDCVISFGILLTIALLGTAHLGALSYNVPWPNLTTIIFGIFVILAWIMSPLILKGIKWSFIITIIVVITADVTIALNQYSLLIRSYEPYSISFILYYIISTIGLYFFYKGYKS